MREILFRGQRIDNNEWVYGGLVTTNHLGLRCYILKDIGGISIQVIPETLGQLWIPSNNIRVFDGDIVKAQYSLSSNGDIRDRICIVESNSKGYNISIWHNNEKLAYSFMAHKSIRVIGNIHQNKELLQP